MKLKIKSSLGAATAACLLSILPCLSQGNVIRPMIFLFDPAVKGGNPTLKCRPSEHAEDTVKKVRIVSFALDTQEAVLQTSDISAADTVSFVLPNRGKDDFLGVRVEDITSGKPVKIAEWHAMYKQGKSLLDYMGSPKLKKPADFKVYWDRTRKELSACPMNATITPVPERNSATGNLYKVTLNSFGNVTVACWYFVPKDVDPLNPKPGDKKYPAMQLMPGWGGEMGPVDRTSEGLITLSLNPRGHGSSNDYFPLPPSHHTWNIDNPETYYYRAAYMDCVRGIDFLSSRPEVNHSHIGAEGNSQGGALTVAVTALDPRVTCACSNVTYLSNFWDFGKLGTLGSGVTFLEMMNDPVKGAKVQKTLAYIDVANLAEWIKCPLQVCVGGEDRVCPPICGITVLNRLPKGVKKELVIDPVADHEVWETMTNANKAWRTKYLLNK